MLQMSNFTCESLVKCSADQKLNYTSCECTCKSVATCPIGKIFNTSTCQCECEVETQCCDGQAFDDTSCSCRCKDVPKCSAGYVLNPDSCRCVCAGSINEDIWKDRIRECWKDKKNVFNIFTCSCECPNYIRCKRKKVVHPRTCKCVRAYLFLPPQR